MARAGYKSELAAEGQDNITDAAHLLFCGMKLIALRRALMILPTNPRLVVFVKVVNKKWVQRFHLFERPHVALWLKLDIQVLCKRITRSILSY